MIGGLKWGGGEPSETHRTETKKTTKRNGRKMWRRPGWVVSEANGGNPISFRISQPVDRPSQKDPRAAGSPEQVCVKPVMAATPPSNSRLPLAEDASMARPSGAVGLVSACRRCAICAPVRHLWLASGVGGGADRTDLPRPGRCGV